jgi:hypothetical protein
MAITMGLRASLAAAAASSAAVLLVWLASCGQV